MFIRVVLFLLQRRSFRRKVKIFRLKCSRNIQISSLIINRARFLPDSGGAGKYLSDDELIHALIFTMPHKITIQARSRMPSQALLYWQDRICQHNLLAKPRIGWFWGRRAGKALLPWQYSWSKYFELLTKINENLLGRASPILHHRVTPILQFCQPAFEWPSGMYFGQTVHCQTF